MHVSFPVVLGGSAIIGTLGGVAVMHQSEWLGCWLPGRRFAAVVGTALIGLATLILIPLVTTQPGFALLSMVFGGLLAIGLPGHGETASTSATTTVIASALTMHQLLEGAVLATAYITGGAVGVLAAMIITAHTVAETAILGGVYTTANRRKRGFVAILIMQVSYVIAAVVAIATVISVPPLVMNAVSAVVAGALLRVGMHECRHALPNHLHPLA